MPFIRFIAIFLAILPLSAQTYRAVLYNGAGQSQESRLFAMALAGIVNRDSARLYLLNVYETWSYNQTDEVWRDLYRSRGGVVFDSTTSLATLISKFIPFIKGGIRYDPLRTYSNFSGQSFRWQAEFAALVGALTDRVPVTAGMAAGLGITVDDSILVTDVFDNDAPVWVPGKLDSSIHAWNAGFLTEEQRYFAIIDWGVSTLLPLCNPSKFYLREITDFTVRHRMFQVNLAGTNSLDIFSLPTAKADRLEMILTYLHAKNPSAIFHIYGWMHPEPLTQWFAFFGASFHETLLGNLSWHSSFPMPARTLTPSSVVSEDTVTVRNKRYLLFIGTEGDASNWNFSFQSGAWLSSSRGAMPVGWGWNLHLLDACPFVAQYYYDTASPNDGFVSVTSPLGYFYPDLLPTGVWQGAIDSSRALMERFGLREVYGYKHYASSGLVTYRGKTISNSFDFSRYGQFQSAIGARITMLYDPIVATQIPFVNFGTLMFNHVTAGYFENSFYADVSDLATASQRILRNAALLPAPSFLIAGYQRFRQDDMANRSSKSIADISLPLLLQLVALLKADPVLGETIEIVTPQYFTALIRKHLGLTSAPAEGSVPDHISLSQNYPNPFNPSTHIRFSLPRASHASLIIYSVSGEEVAQLFTDKFFPSGWHGVTWHADVPSGMYFYRLKVSNPDGGAAKTGKMLLLR